MVFTRCLAEKILLFFSILLTWIKYDAFDITFKCLELLDSARATNFPNRTTAKVSG